ncbi:F-box protein CPR1-like [Papaver somniferum]|uniref:F-box protein CPR1-like n=1 Tax=Papaver somniferum TaxID=3469 RepID=UPI000E70073B|nr:F-box protein CPR1-like [Papaver somniferum]
MSYGFSYDSRIDDYKMIRVVNFANEDDSCEVRVYTLGNDSWKSLGFIPYHLSYGRAPGSAQPESLSEKFHVSVCGFESLLCLLANNFQVHMDIWVMKEYGIRDSWTKLFRISQPTDIRLFHYVKPFQIRSRALSGLVSRHLSMAALTSQCHKKQDGILPENAPFVAFFFFVVGDTACERSSHIVRT